jgi:hypothetical protein
MSGWNRILPSLVDNKPKRKRNAIDWFDVVAYAVCTWLAIGILSIILMWLLIGVIDYGFGH